MILADSAINFLGWFCFWQQEKAAGWPVWRHARRTLSEIMVQGRHPTLKRAPRLWEREQRIRKAFLKSSQVSNQLNRQGTGMTKRSAPPGSLAFLTRGSFRGRNNAKLSCKKPPGF
ncbi:uncharacterized protein CIMG_05111 [Coccidioides immitis RS]|uniref:Uncharacterized protein n=1 Tax=Coccidioides immitis (strain RS) TaxID=246410 RepID=J3KEX0_COCIM|nr:uncharacterized protein CIMG_05111 [Coccidioides immitis RS]EAS34087.3 hypothetical protein CIMG_05111 [Coccidioides immitis RS]